MQVLIDSHISIDAMWAYRSTKTQFSQDAIAHISQCDDCLSLLGVCQISESLKEAERRLKNRNCND
jgi:hypothetical protein